MKTLKEYICETNKANESKVNSEDTFREYAEVLFKKAFEDDFDKDKMKKVVDGILKDHADADWGEKVGILKNSLNESLNEEKVELWDFTFLTAGHGHYNVTYTSPKTGEKWQHVISDMTIIDDTKTADEPKRNDLERLTSIIKRVYSKIKK